MPTHSIFGASAPPGTYTLYSDGTPNIVLGHTFYKHSTALATGRCIGGRIWCPPGTTMPAQVTIMAWSVPTGVRTASDNLDTTPLRSVTINTVSGGWAEATWTPFDLPANGYRVMIGYQFVGADNVKYLHTPNLRASDDFIAASDGAPLVLSEDDETGSTFGPVKWAYIKIGSTVSSPASVTTGYGIDILVDEGSTGDPEPLTIAQENTLTGSTRSFWHDGVDAVEMPAFARSSHYAPGETAELSIDYNAAFDVEIWRLGYYAGDGARKVEDAFAGTPASQPEAVTIPNSNGAVECSGWSVNASWDIPATATPGWYYALLKGTGGTDFGYVLFCVTDTLDKKPIVIVSSESTWGAAYNYYGGKTAVETGKSLYGSGGPGSTGGSTNRALAVSYDRPIVTREGTPQTHFFNGEYATLRFFERFGFEVGYATIEQINADPTVLDGRDVIVFSGHNEYVPVSIMNKTKALISAGVTNILNLAGNDFFWRVRFGTTDAAATTTNGRVMWCRKDTMEGPGAHVAGVPFVSAAEWQGTWQDTRWTLREPSSAFMGDRFIANGIRDDAVLVPFARKDAPIWRHCTGIQTLTSGGTFSFGAGTAGMEWDMLDGTLERAVLSEAVVDLENSASDVNGESYVEDGIHTHSIALVKASLTSSAIANFNTTQWGWALDNFHDRGTAIATAEARQATLNIIADLGGVPVSSLVTAAGLTNPTPVSDIATAYGLSYTEPEPSGIYYSDGITWTQIIAGL